MTAPLEAARRRAASLAIWSGPVDPQPLPAASPTSTSSSPTPAAATSCASAATSPSTTVVAPPSSPPAAPPTPPGSPPRSATAEPGALVLDFIDGRTFAAADVRDPANLDRLADLVRRCHREIPKHFRGPAPLFWVFQVVRDYAHTLRRRAPPRARPTSPPRRALEAAVGPVEIVFGHNDLLPANILDDGRRLWLVDWEYAGFNSPALRPRRPRLQRRDAARECAQPCSKPISAGPPTPALRRRVAAMTAASLLRETLWSMVSERHSAIDFDYAAYTAENRARFEAAWAAFQGDAP